MESIAKLQQYQPLYLSLHRHRSSFPIPISSIKIPPSPSSSPFKFSSIRASSSSSEPLHHLHQNPKPSHFPTLTPLVSSILKTTVTTLTAAAFFFMRFHHKPAIATPIATPTVETSEESAANVSFNEKERLIEEQLSRNPDDTEALRSLMEVRIRAHKLSEAVEVLDRLIELEPGDFEWLLLKANIHSFMGELELARNEFEEILSKDPFSVEAYHGLVMAVSQSSGKLKDVLRRVEKAMERCEKEKKNSDLRDFKLLVAQIRVMEANYVDALKLYEELVKEEPRDFRPYLCQGIIYTLLRKKNEAEKQFEKFRRLVPKNHPYKEYFDDNMFATKLFSQKVEMERAGSKG
ncbi:protein SLOW GREEN 1, chloroplastic [Ziziphus jujuba]|uniref:Protein SLOW GREEN 1, chloroplastic n=2 Tax=Ziziphus jujuba TaxID=326968 RepID=A0A6P4AN06_ZIZJJ|nr:protein SLOW GREEN 1, chloroplastic [Ziziphus jujuba]KAH7512985.1 hypothetical protein FEM48_Zijuj12G0148400 [Ziziphus jujuba var. spinosa]